MSSGHDEVDAILDAWRQQLPAVDTSPMRVFSRVSRLARILDLNRRKAFSSNGLEAWEFDVLSALRRSGQPYALTPGQLMAELLVTSGTMTNRIDRLEKKSLVSRSPCPADRRAVLVTITPAGISRVDAALNQLIEVERRMLASLDDDAAEQLARLLRTVLIPLDR